MFQVRDYVRCGSVHWFLRRLVSSLISRERPVFVCNRLDGENISGLGFEGTTSNVATE